MNTVDAIKEAICKLREEDQVTIRAWFAEFDAVAWDSHFEQDVAAGKLDALAEEALRDRREERCTPL
jgi:hypothetical protein